MLVRCYLEGRAISLTRYQGQDRLVSSGDGRMIFGRSRCCSDMRDSFGKQPIFRMVIRSGSYMVRHGMKHRILLPCVLYSLTDV